MRPRIPWMLFLVGCVNSNPTAQGADSTHTARPSAEAPIALSDSAPLGPDQAQDASWQLADRGDPMHLAVLARRLGAKRLAELVLDGGRSGAIALAAFEHAPDSYAERASLCSLLPRLSPPFRERALAGLSRMLSAGPEGAEDIGADATSRCQQALDALPNSELTEDERDIVSVVRSALAAGSPTSDAPQKP